MPMVIELSRHPDLLPWDAGIANPLPDLLFVAVVQRRVDVAVAMLQGVFHCDVRGVGAALPGSEADWGDGASTVQEGDWAFHGVGDTVDTVVELRRAYNCCSSSVS